MAEITGSKEIIEDIKLNLGELTPRQISDYSVRLAIHYGNIGQQLADADMDYAKTFEKIRFGTDTDKQAEMKSKSTEEYHNKCRLEFATKGLKEIIQALKKRLSVIENEIRNRY